MRVSICTAIVLACSAASAGSGVNTATLDILQSPPDGSEIDLAVEFFTYVGSDTSTVQAEVGGTIVIEADDFSNPSQLTLHSLDIEISPAIDLEGEFDGGPILGNGTYTFSLSQIIQATGPIDSDTPAMRGGFSFSSIPLTLTGSTGAAYSVLGLEPVVTPIIFDLETLDPTGASLVGVNVSASSGLVTLTGTLVLERTSVTYVTALVETRIDATVSLFARGVDPDPGEPNICSRIDIAEPCGLIDLADIVAFVAGFSSQDPISDINGDGVFDLSDITEFITLFQSAECAPGVNYDCYYVGIEFDKGDASYAMGRHTMTTGVLAMAGFGLMLGFGALRRRLP